MFRKWIQIPAGSVLLDAGGYLKETARFDVAAFTMGRFPVTNVEFGRFVTAGGYDNPAWWSRAGWAARTRCSWTEPRFWHGRDWTQPDHPVVGVSWFEALAYCRWLSAEMATAVTLPTEQQWQRAAQGDDGRGFPWGSAEPAAHLCNWNRALDETSPVAAYPAGASPFGVFDMAGNVWEWCRTGWEGETVDDDDRQPRILRGGSWSSDSPISLMVNNRNGRDPNTRLRPHERNLTTVGFRCVLAE